MLIASIHVGPVQFDQPIWLLLIPILGALTIWWARSSLSGLGTTSRRIALAVRLIVIAFIAGAVAQPQWRREAKDIAVVAIVDQSESIPVDIKAKVEQFLRDAATTARNNNLMGQVTVARDAYVQSLPGPPGDRPDSQNIGATDGTNLAEGVNLGLAVVPDSAAGRMLIISDFNETEGQLNSTAQAARAAGVPIDVLPIRYRYKKEIMMERLVTPATGRLGEHVNMRVIINATVPMTGRLDLSVNGRAIDLDPDSPATGVSISLKEGANAIPIPLSLSVSGANKFEANFTPDDRENDTLIQNNRQSSVTFVTGQGKVLILASDTAQAADLVQVLNLARIETEVRAPSEAPKDSVEVAPYDAVVFVNVPAWEFSQAQQEMFRAYVHDLGGGLVMLGGDQSFGAGGWIDSPTAEALPLKLEIPDKRKMPKGALAMIVHSCEMPQGNYWGKEVCLAAVDALSPRDMAGVIEFGGLTGREYWLHDLKDLGNKASIKRAINSLTFGDAPSFEGFLQTAIGPMEQAPAGQKMAIIISDGDPSPPSKQLMQRFIDAKIVISTFCVFPHMGGMQTMQNMADATGGKHYFVNDASALAELPKFIIKEAQKVKRNLIWEGNPVNPIITAGGTEAMRGISAMPPVTGYIVTAEREDRLCQVVLSVKSTDEDVDPLLAQGQYGLGKSIAFTSDAYGKWARSWLGWSQYKQFWEQHMRWVMRPSASAELRVSTEDNGEKTRVIVEAFEPDGKPFDHLRWRGALVGPDGKSEMISLSQFAPGQYQASVDSSRAGTYMMSFRYDAPPDESGKSREGAVQAAITRPYASEYRQLQDNAALAEQIAKLTGGRVIPDNPALADLWSKEGLKMPVATRPIWLTVAIAAITLFLMDVAVRRVRIDFAAMAGFMRRGASKSRSAGSKQLGSLREARERAKEGMAARTSRAEGAATPAPPGATGPAKAARSVKFEASEEELAAARKSAGPLTERPIESVPAQEAEPKQKKPEVSAEEGMSRLLKAKRRAQDDMTQDS
ncbi:MAG: glutamine amidotransferase [Phycisphaerales bacterium]